MYTIGMRVGMLLLGALCLLLLLSPAEGSGRQPAILLNNHGVRNQRRAVLWRRPLRGGETPAGSCHSSCTSAACRLTSPSDDGQCSVKQIDSTAAAKQSLSSSEMAFKDLSYIEALTKKTLTELESEGWKAIVPPSAANSYSVYQRPDGNNSSLAQYLVIALLPDVSPRVALHININEEQRKKWDVGLKDLYSLPAPSAVNAVSAGHNADHIFSKSCYEGFDEVLYYRSKCPWPMKDRDYVMSRRCHVYEDRGGAVVLSSAISDARVGGVPSGVQRMDSYRSLAGFVSSRSNGGGGSADGSLMDAPGSYYVSLSTDEQAAASPSALRIMNAVAGRLIADYMKRMSSVAESAQKQRGNGKLV